MSFNLTTSWTYTQEDSTTVVGYLADSVDDEAHDEIHGGADEVATGVTDQAISLGGLTTVEAMILKSNVAVSFKVNGVTTAIACKAFAIRGAAITSLSVSNASGSLAVVKYQMSGT